MLKFKTLFVFPVYSLFISLIFLTSCYGQEEENARENRFFKQERNANDSLPQEDQIYIDPLFEIEGQLCQHVRRMFQDKSGDLWLGTNVYGLMRYNGDTLEYFSEKDGLGGGRITGIVEDEDGNVWFGTYGGLTKYDPSASLKTGEKPFTTFTELDGLISNDIWSLIIDSKGEFWIGTINGISRFDGRNFTTFPIPKAQVSDTTSILSYNRITSIMEDRTGTFWFGTDGFGICKYDPSALTKLNEETETVEEIGFTHITKKDGLCDNNISSIMEDKNGNVWIGTMYGGVSLYDPSASRGAGGKTFTNFTEDGIISGIEISGLYEDRIGNIWFAAENHGVYRYDPSASLKTDGETGSAEQMSFTNLYKKEGLISNGILSILEDEDGQFWFGGWLGLFRFDGKAFFSVTKNGPWE